MTAGAAAARGGTKWGVPQLRASDPILGSAKTAGLPYSPSHPSHQALVRIAWQPGGQGKPLRPSDLTAGMPQCVDVVADVVNIVGSDRKVAWVQGTPDDSPRDTFP